MRRWSTWLARGGALAGGVLLLATAALAQQSSGRGVVLHEYFDPAAVGESGRSAPSSGSGLPAGSARNAERPPGLTLDPGAGDVILGPEGPVDSAARSAPYGPSSPRSGASTLDSKTSRVDDLDYNASFDPSVFPYKRNVSQNRAERTSSGQYRFETSEGSVERIRVGGAPPRPQEDTFWGTFLVRAERGAKHPIPSVAPTQRILEVRTEPSTSVEVFRDDAGNYYVGFDYDGLVRLNMQVAAPRFYFAGRFTGDVAWSEFDGRASPELPSNIQPVARRVASTVGVSRRMSPRKVVRRLIYYYRNFETRELPDRAKRGDLYESISERQIGVCRHRSMGFVLTARHLGIPARYVTNEAHAFVEMWWPAGGWRRVDLGGAAREISYNGQQGDRLHDGADRDPLPKPPKYRDALERLREQNAESGGDGGGSAGESQTPESAGERGESAGTEPTGRDAGTGRRVRERPDAGAPSRRRERERRRVERADERTESEPPGDGRGTRLTLRTESRTVFRGGEVTVNGILRTSSGDPVSGAAIELYFGRVGASPSQMERLGTARTSRSGRYRVKVTVPETTGIGRWSLVAVFPGDERFQKARAE